jgi:hypothetical protein
MATPEIAVDRIVRSARDSWRCPIGDKSCSCRLESPDVRVCTRTIKLVVPCFNTTLRSDEEERSCPDIAKTACIGVLELEVMAMGNLADEEVTVTVRPAGRPSSEPSLRIVASAEDR